MANLRAKLIPQSRLHEIFEYRDGQLFWKHDPHQRKQWNAQRVGKPAGWLDKNLGYVIVTFQANPLNGLPKTKSIALHQLIFCFHHGHYPQQVDHISGDRGDNRIENLRPALAHQNAANRAKMSNNTTGVPGVRKHRDGRYEARVCFAGKRHQVGSFKTIDEAQAAIIAASRSIKGEWHREAAR